MGKRTVLAVALALLVAGLPAVAEPEPTVVFSGTVIVPGGDPASGAEVLVASPSAVLARTTCDDRGEFALEVPAGHATMLLATASGSVGLDWPLDADRGQYGCRIELEPARRIDGWVSDEAGAPISGAEVRALFYAWPGSVASTVSAGDGTFTIDGVPQGASIVAVHPDFLPSRAIGGPIPSFVHAVLRRGRPLDGRVLDAAGEPVAGAVVTPVSGTHSFSPARTDEGGRFSAEVPAEGVFCLQVDAGPSGHLETDFLLWTGSLLELRLPESVRMAGRVVTDSDAGDRVGVPAVRVEAQPWAVYGGGLREVSAMTAADGSFLLEGLGARDRIHAWSPDWQVLDGRNAPRAGEPGPGEIRVAPRTFLAGTVVDMKGRPVPGAWVDCRERTDGGGRFEIAAAGCSYVRAWHPVSGYGGARLPGPGAPDFLIRLRKGRSVSGRVVDEAGRPVADVAITAAVSFSRTVPSEERWITVWSRGDGSFRIENILPETIVLLGKEGYEDASIRSEPRAPEPPSGPDQVVEVRTEEEFHPAIALRRLTEIHGRIVDGEGEPVWSARVEIRDGERTDVDRAGRFRIRLRRHEASLLRVEAPGVPAREFELRSLPAGRWTVTPAAADRRDSSEVAAGADGLRIVLGEAE